MAKVKRNKMVREEIKRKYDKNYPLMFISNRGRYKGSVYHQLSDPEVKNGQPVYGTEDMAANGIGNSLWFMEEYSECTRIWSEEVKELVTDLCGLGIIDLK